MPIFHTHTRPSFLRSILVAAHFCALLTDSNIVYCTARRCIYVFKNCYCERVCSDRFDMCQQMWVSVYACVCDEALFLSIYTLVLVSQMLEYLLFSVAETLCATQSLEQLRWCVWSAGRRGCCCCCRYSSLNASLWNEIETKIRIHILVNGVKRFGLLQKWQRVESTRSCENISRFWCEFANWRRKQKFNFDQKRVLF